MKRIRLLWLIVASSLLLGCAARIPSGRAKYDISDFEKPGEPRPLDVSDPFETVNRGLYRFNYNFDRFIFLPVTESYAAILPDYIEERISNFFNNVGEFNNLTNAMLQVKPKSAGITLSRFLINSTLGVGGLWDPATDWELQRQDEDFGQTLGHYGAGNGPYVVLPVLGPSNLRDFTGQVADAAAFAVVDPLNLTDNNNWQFPYQMLRIVDARHRQPFRYYKSGSPFEYEYVRLLYTEKRKLQIAK